MSRKKRKHSNENESSWLLSYADLMTLLLALFVLLYALSKIDMGKFKKLAYSFAHNIAGQTTQMSIDDFNGDSSINLDDLGTGDFPTSNSNDGDLESDTGASGQDQPASEATQEMYRNVSNFINKSGLSDVAAIKEDNRGVIIEFREKILFDTGKADIKEKGFETLSKVSELIRSIPNKIIVEGHTDNVPIAASDFPSNWELSSARAVKVLRYLIDARKLDPKRFSAIAYGEYQPIVSNDTADGRAQNRRVNILIVTNK